MAKSFEQLVPAPAGRADNFAWPCPESVPPSTSLNEPPEPASTAAPAPSSDAAKQTAPPKQPAPVAPKRRAMQVPPPGPQGG